MAVAPQPKLKAPFPWFGGKSRVAHLVWERFGDVPNYVEPFFGSGAVLLGRPHPPRIETVNDKDGYVANFWRALQADPEAVAKWCDWPVNENDLHARHAWLVEQRPEFTARLEGDPEFYDAKVAGWWVWGLCSWIGSGWCSGKGPWQREDGFLVNRQLPRLGDAGRGVNRQLPHLGDAGRGVNRQLPHLGNAGQGVNRQLPHLGNAGQGVLDMLLPLSERLRRVRVCCGEWDRILGLTPTLKFGTTAVLLDPPYENDCFTGAYSVRADSIEAKVRAWCIEHGDEPDLRIALCGYEGAHDMPDTWECVAWKAQGGYGSQSENGKGRVNSRRERIWFSPHCLKPELLF